MNQVERKFIRQYFVDRGYTDPGAWSAISAETAFHAGRDFERSSRHKEGCICFVCEDVQRAKRSKGRDQGSAEPPKLSSEVRVLGGLIE